jgi:hypothetical protein
VPPRRARLTQTVELDVLTGGVRFAGNLANVRLIPSNIYRRLAVSAVQPHLECYLLQSPETVILRFPILVHKYSSVMLSISLRLLQQCHQ